MAASQTAWYLRKPKGWVHFQSVRFSRLLLFLAAVFLLFATFGFFGDLMGGGHLPYLIVLINVLLSGLMAALLVLVMARLSLLFLVIPIGLSIFNAWIIISLADWLTREYRLRAVAGDAGIRFCAIGIMIALMLSYVFFISFIRREGRESFKLRNELELAHGIQKTLVPPFTLRTARFEIYGISQPSEKVGGDLVDAVSLSNGDAIAYLGDIAGHGLQAGILMGMLKTATRTALLEAAEREPGSTLPVLFDRLNTVLPSVKEPHMYATFSGFRLCADGTVYFALAASPPVLHWHANRHALSKVEEEQFPLGLLPVSQFDGRRLQMESGDLLVVATDGILEVCDRRGEEFGAERLEQSIGANAAVALPEVAARILEATRVFGRQSDDQTVLLMRCI